MTAYEPQFIQIAAANLPLGAELAIVERPYAHAAVCTADIDGDRVPELAAVYRLNGEYGLMVLRFQDGAWRTIGHARGPGSGVTQLTALPVTRAGASNFVVGWQLEYNLSKLSVYEWTRDGLRDAAPPDLCYSYMEAMDMPGQTGPDGKAELALWLHAARSAYQVEVLRWQNGAFVTAVDAYPYYYPGVARYYEQLTRQHPSDPAYWYYLADAQHRAGYPQPALASIHRALEHVASPNRELLIALDRSIRSGLQGPESADAQEAQGILRAVALFPASQKEVGGTKWGYIDSAGKWVIPPRFGEAGDFQTNGLAYVSEHGKFGLIDTTGHFVVKPIYDSINAFKEHRAVVIDSKGFKLIDERGKVLTKQAYPFIADMQHGRALYYTTSDDGAKTQYGYLDTEGNEVIPARFMEANDFAGDVAIVKIKDDEYAMIGKDGHTMTTYAYPFVGQIGDNRLPFQKEANGKYGYLDAKGDVVIAPAYTLGLPFHDGRAIVNTAEDYNNAYGAIDEHGKFIVQPDYNEIRDLGQERFGLGRPIDDKQPFIGSRFAIADWNGARLTDFVFYELSNYKDGLASVSDAKHTYFVDHSGKAAEGYPRIDGSGYLTLEQDGIIKAMIDERLSYLDRSGRMIWKYNTLIPLAEPYVVKEIKFNPNRNYLVYYPQIGGMRDQAGQRNANAKLAELSQVKPIPPNQQLDYSYDGDFDVNFFKKELLQLELTGYHFPFGAAHGMPTQTYPIVHLTNGRIFALQDLFKPGSDYVKSLSAIVAKQIKEDPQYDYVFPDMYKGIQPDQPFYVSENALHLYFNPYDIAPYVAGFPTFTIPFKQIMNLIDTEGEFWRAFH